MLHRVYNLDSIADGDLRRSKCELLIPFDVVLDVPWEDDWEELHLWGDDDDGLVLLLSPSE